MPTGGQRYLTGASTAAGEPTVGELADWVHPLPAESTGSDLDRAFRRAPQLRSVVVNGRGGCPPFLVNRSDFYLHFSGKLGYGRALLADKPADPTISRDTPVYPRDTSAVAAALDLVQASSINTIDDVGVVDDDGSLGTLSVATLFRHLRETAEDAAQQARRSERRFRALVKHAADGVMVFDGNAMPLYVSPAAEALLGSQRCAAFVADPAAVVDPADLAGFERMLDAAQNDSREAVTGELSLHGQDGHRIICVAMRNRLSDPDVEGLVVNIADVTEERRLSQQLQYQASHDSLTGLPNRARFTAEAARIVARRDGVNSAAILFCDLDGFKAINDRYGHAVGDAVLVAVAQRFSRQLPPTALLARLGGDEFAVVMTGDGSAARALAGTLAACLLEPITALGQTVVVAASVGIATTGESGEFGVLLQRADEAMYASKREGWGTITQWRRTVHDPSTVDRVADELLPALDNGQMSLHYQPIVGVATRNVTGFEALLRWTHPELGPISPADFVHVAEARRLMVPLGRWVIDTALATCGRWQATGGVAFAMNINLSTTQLLDPALETTILGGVQRHGLDPGDVVVELTETALMTDIHESATALQSLRAAGIRIAVDDFGVGYSSLSYLSDLPIDIVKLDARFIRQLTRGQADRDLARGIVALVHSMGLQIVAEAVEYEEEHALVEALGFDLGQGYLYGRPAAVTAIDIATTAEGLRG